MTPTLDKKWFALYTRGRHEKFIDSELAKRRIESFLPLRKIKRRWSDRMVTVEEPLFSSYLFVKTNPVESLEVLKTKGAVRFVGLYGSPIPVQESVIESLRTVVNQELALDPFPYLEEGDRVRVRSGIFKGVEGYIVRKNTDKCRLVISIAAIRASIAVEVDAAIVDVIARSPERARKQSLLA